MKKFAGMTVTALALCALVGLMAFAKGKSHTISFNENTIVNGIVVKKGEYQATFDEQTSKLSIRDSRHVVATMKAKEKALGKKAPQTIYDLHQSANGPVLTQVTFGGDHYTLLLDEEGY